MKIFARGWSHGFDGPGRRLVYYLKGCNFRCLWCGNPESIAFEPEIMFYPEKSEFATQCCPHGAVCGNVLEREKCAQCCERSCVNLWRDRAFELAGKEISTVEIVAEAESRRAMFGGDGGVTFSGGEPTMQMDELLDVVDALRGRGINLVLENNASSPRFRDLLGRFDLLICDLKCVTAELHRRIVGADNRQVLENLRAAVNAGENLVIRIPLIRELNFTAEEQERFVAFLAEIRPPRVELLRLHQLGLPKYEALGQSCPAEQFNPPDDEELEKFRQRLETYKINVESIN